MDFGVEMDGSQDFFQMFWPVVVSHKIDDKSPLYAMSARDIAEHTFEIVLTMEGITPETGNTVQVGEIFNNVILSKILGNFYMFTFTVKCPPAILL